MEDIDDILYDDSEAKFVALQNKKKNRKHKRRRLRYFVLLLLIMIGGLYFSSDLSKVTSLQVSGNLFYDKETVLKKAGLSYNTRYIVMPEFYIAWKLEKDDVIDHVNVNKKMDGTIRLKVTEKAMIGYLVENNKNYMLINDGSKIEIESTYLDAIVNYPLIDGFHTSELQNLCAGFAKKGNVISPEIIHMISEIAPYASSYDDHMVKIVMQDGNTIYSSYDSIPMMNNYLETLKGLNKSHACLWPDITTGSIQSLDCAKNE